MFFFYEFTTKVLNYTISLHIKYSSFVKKKKTDEKISKLNNLFLDIDLGVKRHNSAICWLEKKSVTTV